MNLYTQLSCPAVKHHIHLYIFVSDDALWENKNKGDSEDAISYWIQKCVWPLVPLYCSVSLCSSPHSFLKWLSSLFPTVTFLFFTSFSF